MSTLKVGTIQDHTNSNTAISIDSSGRVLQPAKPLANVSYTASDMGAHIANNDKILVFNVANLNQGNHYDTSNGKFTCPVTGIYQVTAYALDDESLNSGAMYLQVNVNGIQYGTLAGSYSSSASHVGGHISKLISCTAGQEITISYSATNGIVSGYAGATFMLVG